jgi:hypothetical protein
MPCHHNLDRYLEEYVAAAGTAGDPKGRLFRTLRNRAGLELTGNAIARARGAGVCRTSRRTGWRWLAWAATCTGTARDISRFRRFGGLPSTVTAARSISADAFARRSSGRPRPARLERVLTRKARPIAYSSSPTRAILKNGVDRPASRHAGPAPPASTSSLVQHGRAAMPKPMIDIPLASLRCRPEALPGRSETADTVAAA